ncbi:MAG: sugar phosphate isomerase/epimerase [Saprospiraceae bacterium]
MKSNYNRRQFITHSSIVTMGALISFNPTYKKLKRIQLGVISYSFRSVPHDVDKLLAFCVECNANALEMMGDPAETYAGKPVNPIVFGPPPAGGQRPALTDDQKAQLAEYNKQVVAWRSTVSMDKFKEIGAKFKNAGINIYAFKPNAFGVNNSDAEIDYGMNAASALGATCVTVELPTDPAQSKRLGDFGEKHNIYVGYHAHLQATDTLWDTALSQSPFNSMNLDCGHYIAAGGKNTKESLLALIENKHERITSLHIKDRTNSAHGAGNVAWGKGDTPIIEILQLMKSKKYTFPATVELEYDIPGGSDAVQEVKKCIAYANKALS